MLFFCSNTTPNSKQLSIICLFDGSFQKSIIDCATIGPISSIDSKSSYEAVKNESKSP